MYVYTIQLHVYAIQLFNPHYFVLNELAYLDLFKKCHPGLSRSVCIYCREDY